MTFKTVDKQSLSITGVNETLKQREQQRYDRMIGSSRAQNLMIHKGKIYDLEINTDNLTIEDSVMEIIKLLS